MSKLDQILQSIWAELCEGVRDRRHGFHLPVLASCSEEGVADSRVVVLRRIDPDQRAIHCNTDRRAPKVASLRVHPTVSWLFYDFERRTQLRIRAHAEVLTDGPLVDEAWQGSSVDSRRCYLAPNAPGAESAQPSANLPASHLTRNPSPEESEAGRDHFAIVRSQATRIDWLHLASGGHRRARFTFEESTGWSAGWIEP